MQIAETQSFESLDAFELLSFDDGSMSFDSGTLVGLLLACIFLAIWCYAQKTN